MRRGERRRRRSSARAGKGLREGGVFGGEAEGGVLLARRKKVGRGAAGYPFLPPPTLPTAAVAPSHIPPKVKRRDDLKVKKKEKTTGLPRRRDARPAR